MRRCTEDFRFVVDKKEDLTAPAENGIEGKPVADRQPEDGEHIPETIRGAGTTNDAGLSGPIDEPSRGSVLMFRARGPVGLMLDIRRMDHRKFLKKILAAIMGN